MHHASNLFPWFGVPRTPGRSASQSLVSLQYSIFEAKVKIKKMETHSNNIMGSLSDDQAAVYDRQLRVWGLEVQNRWLSCVLDVKSQHPMRGRHIKSLKLKLKFGMQAFISQSSHLWWQRAGCRGTKRASRISQPGGIWFSEFGGMECHLKKWSN